ncbi:MAG TPA: hypothetical protein VM938_10635 [Acidimicrobiales bacterium]|nr:hypothetical protein [Acidimicrobiales bacterium]
MGKTTRTANAIPTANDESVEVVTEEVEAPNTDAAVSGDAADDRGEEVTTDTVAVLGAEPDASDPKDGDPLTATVAAAIERNREAAADFLDGQAGGGIDFRDRALVNLSDAGQFPSSVTPADAEVVAPSAGEIAGTDAAAPVDEPAAAADLSDGTDVSAAPHAADDVEPEATVEPEPEAVKAAPEPEPVTFVCDRYPNLIAYSPNGELVGQFVDGKLVVTAQRDIDILEALPEVKRA